MNAHDLACEIAELRPDALDTLRHDLGLPLVARIFMDDLEEVAEAMLKTYSPGDALAQLKRRGA